MVYANGSCLVPWNLLEPLLGTLTWNSSLATLTWTPWNLYAEPSPLQPSETLPVHGTSSGTWLETFTWNLATSPEPVNAGTLSGLEPLLGTLEFLWLARTSKPCGTLRDDCHRVPQGLGWDWDPKLSAVGVKPEQNQNFGILQELWNLPWNSATFGNSLETPWVPRLRLQVAQFQGFKAESMQGLGVWRPQTSVLRTPKKPWNLEFLHWHVGPCNPGMISCAKTLREKIALENPGAWDLNLETLRILGPCSKRWKCDGGSLEPLELLKPAWSLGARKLLELLNPGALEPH